MRSIINRLTETTESLFESVDPTTYGWQQKASGKQRTWAQEPDGERPTTTSPHRYEHPAHPGHQLHVYPMRPPVWQHNKPSDRTMNIRGRTIPAGPDTLAKGNDTRSLSRHLANFHATD